MEELRSDCFRSPLDAGAISARVKKWERYIELQRQSALYQTVAELKTNPPSTPPCSPPVTPRAADDVSKRRWDGNAAIWRRKMKAWQEWSLELERATVQKGESMQSECKSEKGCGVS